MRGREQHETDDTGGRARRLLDGGRRVDVGRSAITALVAPLLRPLLDRIDRGLATGTLDAILPDGSRRRLGGRAPGFECTVHLRHWRALLRLATGGSIGWYQAWEAGEWASPDPVPLFALFMANGATLGGAARAKGPWKRAARALHRLNANTHAGAARNIAAHYDLGNAFYAAWLDPTMTYSSALWAGGPEDAGLPDAGLPDAGPDAGLPDANLIAAQHAKIDAIERRLGAGPGARLLEIGCGWGAAAAAIAGTGATVDAISLSAEQLAWARAAMPPGLDGQVRYLHRDYRDVTDRYDGIYSIEMVEALGRENWPAYMDCLARTLEPGGIAALQLISIRHDLFDAYAGSADFIQAYVFPGGLLIDLPEFRRLAEARGLRWTDQVDFGQDYARTLKLWRDRFDAADAEGRLPAGIDAQFVQLWRYYLMYCEGGFRGGGIDVHQVSLIKA